MTILLYASTKTRQERLALRDNKDRDLFDPEILVEGYEKMKKFLEEFNIPYIPINTENKTLEDVYSTVYQEVEKIMRKEKQEHGIVEPSR